MMNAKNGMHVLIGHGRGQDVSGAEYIMPIDDKDRVLVRVPGLRLAPDAGQKAIIFNPLGVEGVFRRHGSANYPMNVGSIFTHASAAELADLIAAKNFDNAKMKAAWEALPDTVKSSPEGKAWLIEWSRYLERYASALEAANIQLSAANAAQDYIPAKDFPAQDGWDAIMRAERKPSILDDALGRPSTTYHRGDKQDLYNRLVAFRQGVQIDFTGQPQPRKGTDTDLNVMNALAPLDPTSDEPLFSDSTIVLMTIAALSLITLTGAVLYIKVFK